MSSFSMSKFCTEIKASAEALDWLEKEIANSPGPDFHDPCCHFSREDVGTIKVWVDPSYEEDGDPFELARAVAEMQRQFNITETWYITWAVVKDRPIVDGFKGGAAVCYMGRVTGIDPQVLVIETIEKLKSEELHLPRDGDPDTSQL